ncbi:MAG: YkgJ family cysteine cluster protein, partial [Planctomycetota bacterium]
MSVVSAAETARPGCRSSDREPGDGPTLLPLPTLTVLNDAGPGCGPGPSDTGGTPCDECHGGCCRSFAVPVTGADVFRLTRETGLAFWEVACRWPDPDGSIARGYAPSLYFAEAPGEPTVLCLTHRPSETLPGSTRCRFLEEGEPTAEHPKGISRCGVYDRRPSACRAFPIHFSTDGQLVRLHEVPPRGRDGAHPAYDLCPRPWTAEDVDPLTAPGELAAARWEMDFFRRIAAAWNRAPRSADLFPAYLEAI